MDNSRHEGEERGIEKYNRKNATHRLSCCHVIGISRLYYYMDCIILKRMPNYRLKILVFGDRYWSGKDDKKRIRYVDEFRVKPIYARCCHVFCFNSRRK